MRSSTIERIEQIRERFLFSPAILREDTAPVIKENKLEFLTENRCPLLISEKQEERSLREHP